MNRPERDGYDNLDGDIGVGVLEGDSVENVAVP